MEETKNWKTINEPYIKYDSHHAEIVNIKTGEVLKENCMYDVWDEMITYETNFCNNRKNYYQSLVIHRIDIGDSFCSTDWSKH